MDEKRKAWCEKYKVKIADGGTIDKFCGLPEHVTPVLTSDGHKPTYFVGFDGRRKMYDELTEEEIQDLNQREQRIKEKLSEKYRERTRRIKNICRWSRKKSIDNI